MLNGTGEGNRTIVIITNAAVASGSPSAFDLCGVFSK